VKAKRSTLNAQHSTFTWRFAWLSLLKHIHSAR